MRYYFKVLYKDIPIVKKLGGKYHKRVDMWVCYDYNINLFRRWM